MKSLIIEFVNRYKEKKITETKWQEPLIAFADALDPLFLDLKKAVSESHKMPRDILPTASTVITYFIPFQREILMSNFDVLNNQNQCSREWAVVYVETNKLIVDMNEHLLEKLGELNFESTIIPPTHNFDKKKLISNWSHRHVAYIAGLGNFGLNRMLITEKGCGGRIGSLITTAKIEATERKDGEYCLYFHNNSCKKCIERCFKYALQLDSYDKFKCYEACLDNAKFHEQVVYADVCGKCLSNVPFSFKNPVNL